MYTWIGIIFSIFLIILNIRGWVRTFELFDVISPRLCRQMIYFTLLSKRYFLILISVRPKLI